MHDPFDVAQILAETTRPAKASPMGTAAVSEAAVDTDGRERSRPGQYGRVGAEASDQPRG
ncbi:hypothetical protein H9Y04_11905 [Streptomyces sp. TRM66268-LWL]|uniref:Transposase n=1 Tax=Streptomyces polyasparticus TaxID=2767826 RepID=A0ABR7SCQ5_9ACTN|nr:hypothetical protein [Streptomyces polyasparticus]MBC9713272.1 hypothetical protein [Streptomyces polyasparticus]